MSDSSKPAADQDPAPASEQPFAELLTGGPVACPTTRVITDWIDYNGHMNMAYYHVVFDRALDFIFDRIGIGAAYLREQQHSCFTREVHVNYLTEAKEQDPLRVEFQLLGLGSRAIHSFEQMYHADSGTLLATSEQLSLHVDMVARRVAPFPPAIEQRLQTLLAQHELLPRPPQVGQTMAVR